MQAHPLVHGGAAPRRDVRLFPHDRTGRNDRPEIREPRKRHLQPRAAARRRRGRTPPATSTFPETPDPAERFLDILSDSSQKAYQSLLKSDGFIGFYREATPIDALENARIGSRPARRTGKKSHSISDLRAIPWVFSWTQARYYLPGWFGVGTALSS